MPQLDSFFFFSESIVTLVLLYTTIYFYLFWFSKQNFEYWVVSARLNYYFEKQIVYIIFVNSTINTAFSADLKHIYDNNYFLDFWDNQLSLYNAME